MTGPRWRRWDDEYPAANETIVAQTSDGGVATFTGPFWNWRDDALWMPVSEWRDVLARIPEPDNPDEWIVDNGESVKKRGHYVSDRTLVYAEPDYVVAALNAYEGRTR